MSNVENFQAGADAVSAAPPEPSLGDYLVAGGKLDRAGLDRALRAQNENDERLSLVLTRLGLVSERDLAKAFSAMLDLSLVKSKDYPESPVLSAELNPRFLKSAGILPLYESEDEIGLAMIDPLDHYAIEAIALKTARQIAVAVAEPADLEKAFARLYSSDNVATGTADVERDDGTGQASDEDIERLRDIASEAPVIRLVSQIVARAVEARASDIHLEPYETRLRLRYRIDGVLRDEEAPQADLRAAIVSRIKIMAKLNIAERRLPQDGRAKMIVRGKEVDLRISTVPTLHGESVVLRILDRGTVTLEFGALGFDAESLARYLQILERPNGILLVTGPTGSGKTTTLYTSLMHLNSPEKKVVTVEDPIEYQLDGANQIQVTPKIGLSFANALRSILRQDPDIIMIGEIRDLETAQIAVQSALTGHLVLATLHTNTAAATVTRLLDMGVEDYLITSTVNGIVAQRLVRTLCAHCKEPYEALPGLIEQMDLRRFGNDKAITFFHAKGCDHCSGSGYFGRTTLLEILPISDELRELVLQHAAVADIHRLAIKSGMRSMFDDGIRKALSGITSLEEVVRVIREQ